MSGPILGTPSDPLTTWSYWSFVRNQAGVPPQALPDNSPWVPITFNLSMDIVNIFLSQAPQVGDLTYPSQYCYAVYNYGMDRIVNFAQDPVPPFMYPGITPPTPYFQYLRTKFGIDSFVSGVISYAADVTTSASYVVPDWVKQMSLGDMQTLKTPWGRTYMAIAQQYGPTIVDIT